MKKFFNKNHPREIAKSLQNATGTYRGALSRLNEYMRREWKRLSTSEKVTLVEVKLKLQTLNS